MLRQEDIHGQALLHNLFSTYLQELLRHRVTAVRNLVERFQCSYHPKAHRGTPIAEIDEGS